MLTSFKPVVRPILLLASLIALMLLLVACGGGDSSSANAANKSAVTSAPAATPTPGPVTTVQIADNSFTPKELTIKAGTTVRWEWSGSNPHSVLLGGVDSGQHTGSGTYEKVFKDVGVTFAYQCGVHGAAMSGKIIVE